MPASISASASSSARRARGAGCEDRLRVFIGPEEGLAGPCFGAERVGPHG